MRPLRFLLFLLLLAACGSPIRSGPTLPPEPQEREVQARPAIAACGSALRSLEPGEHFCNEGDACQSTDPARPIDCRCQEGRWDCAFFGANGERVREDMWVDLPLFDTHYEGTSHYMTAAVAGRGATQAVLLGDEQLLRRPGEGDAGHYDLVVPFCPTSEDTPDAMVLFPLNKHRDPAIESVRAYFRPSEDACERVDEVPECPSIRHSAEAISLNAHTPIADYSRLVGIEGSEALIRRTRVEGEQLVVAHVPPNGAHRAEAAHLFTCRASDEALITGAIGEAGASFAQVPYAAGRRRFALFTPREALERPREAPSYEPTDMAEVRRRERASLPACPSDLPSRGWRRARFLSAIPESSQPIPSNRLPSPARLLESTGDIFVVAPNATQNAGWVLPADLDPDPDDSDGTRVCIDEEGIARVQWVTQRRTRYTERGCRTEREPIVHNVALWLPRDIEVRVRTATYDEERESCRPPERPPCPERPVQDCNGQPCLDRFMVPRPC